MSRTIAVHVRYKYLYISLPSSAKQQREMAKFCDVYETWTTPANFPYIQLESNVVVAYVAVARFRAIGVPNRSRKSRIALVKYKFIFY